MDGLRPCCFEGAALAAQWGTTARAQNKRWQDAQGKKTSSQQPTAGKQSIAGLRPEGRNEARHLPRMVDRRAAPRRYVTGAAAAAKTGLSGSGARPPRPKRAAAQRRGRRRSVQQAARGRVGHTLTGLVARSALNLSCTRKKPVDCQRPRRRVPRPPPIPPPFPPRREGSESPSVVKGAASGALRFLVCPHDLRLWAFQVRQGPGFALSIPARVLASLRAAPAGIPTLDPLST